MIVGATSRKGNTVSVDRLDSSKGYTLENVVLCCAAINRMKMDMTVDEFRRWCQLVVGPAQDLEV